MEYIKEKTDWSVSDSFNITDFNRIRNNILYIYEYALEMSAPFDLESMGDDISDYSGYWEVEYFNAFEDNVDLLNRNLLSQNYGIKQTFRENAPFITATELNRIESAIGMMQKIVDCYRKAKYRYPFRLGGVKGIRA